MKIKSLILAMAACAGLFSACSNELLEEGNQGNNSNEITSDAYASFVFIMPNGGSATRSNPTGGDEGDGKEEGLGVENQVKDVNIYLFKDDECVQIQKLPRASFTPTNNGSAVEYKTKEPFGVKTGDYNVYLIVNPTSNLDAAIKAKTDATNGMSYNEFIATVESVPTTTGEYCTDNQFMMTTADVKSKTAVTITSQNTKDAPAEITLNVERTAAKITFNFKNDNNSFSITDGQGSIIGTVTFDAYKIINTRNSAYNFKRVGANSSSAIQGAKENFSNYAIENSFDKKTSAFDNTFFQSGYSRKYTDYVAFRSLTGTNPKTNAAPQILAYCLENTMPQDAQIEGYTTSVILRAKATIKGINDGANSDKDLYRYNNKFYTSLYDMVTEYNKGWDQNSVPANDILNIKEGTSKGSSVEEYINSIYKDTKELKALGVDFYIQGYCYYNYKIRHNNNNDNNVMGIMEFAIVRNNIYKLSINTVAQIGNTTSGTPGAPNPNKPGEGEEDNDPKKPNPEIPGTVVPNPEPTTPPTPIIPETPDESTDSYLNVTIEVLSWTVRNNDIDL